MEFRRDLLSIFHAFFAAGSILCTLLAFMIAFYAYKAYRFTERKYMLNFLVGFLMLGVSYYLLAFSLPPFGSPQVAPEYQWPRLMLQLAGFVLIASAYFTKQRRGETIILGAMIVLVAAALPIVVITSHEMLTAYLILDVYFFVTNVALVLYVFFKALQGYVRTQRLGNALTASGFGALTLSQYTWLIWGLDDGTGAFLMAQVFRILSLALFVIAVRLGGD